MKRIMKIKLSLVLALLVVISAGAFVAYRAFAGTETFEEQFYATDENPNSEFSYDSYAVVLKKHVDDKGMVSYADLKDHPEQLEQFVRALGSVDFKTYKSWNESVKIAFWINAYNGLTLKVIIDHYPIKSGFFSRLAYPANSIRQISGVWDKIQFRVMGRKLTLNEIEHGVLRGQNKELVETYGALYEPRIHMALVCAAMSCPTLRHEPYIGDKLDEQLDDQSKRFLSNPTKFRIDRAAGKIYLSSIFKWFGGDFLQKYKPEKGFDSGGSDAKAAVLNYVSRYLSENDAAYLREEKYSIEYLDYDWSLNEQPR
jgi:hypothetical protein